MFEHKDEGHHNDPVNQAYLRRSYPRIVLHLNYLLEVFVALLHVATSILNMEVYPVKYSALFND